jgi:hypothetical protein
MGSESMKKHPGLLRGSGARFVLPRVVYEIAPGFVVGARLDGRSHQVRRLAVREIAADSVEPFAHRSNVANAEDLRAALESVAQTVGNGNGSCGLLIPDGAVRVAVLDFETLPDNRKDTEALVRWRMRDNLPQEPEAARLSLQVLSRESNRVELLVAAVRTAVLADYEQVMDIGNGGLTLVLPATMALLPLVPEEAGGGGLLLHLCGGWLTAVVLENGRVRMWRSLGLQADSSHGFAKSATVEAARVCESARDHLQIRTEKIWLAERPLSIEGLDEEISRSLEQEVVRLSPQSAMGRALSESEHPAFENFAAALAGLQRELK